MYKRDSAGATASFEGGELVIRVRVDGAAGSNGEEWVDVLSVVPLPRKRVASACRRGELRAVKHGSKWLAKRRDVDAFLESGTRPSEVRAAAPRVAEEPKDADDEALAELGLRKAAGR